jgi:hypothetical protein
LQTLAVESLDIVAFGQAGTTYRTADRLLVHS